MAYVDSGVDVTVTYLSNAGESWQYLLNPTHSSEFCVRFFWHDVSMLMRRQKKHSSKNTTWVLFCKLIAG